MHAKFELWSVLVPDINLRSFFVETTLGLFYSFYHNWYQNIQNWESDVFLPSMNKQMKLLMQQRFIGDFENLIGWSDITWNACVT